MPNLVVGGHISPRCNTWSFPLQGHHARAMHQVLIQYFTRYLLLDHLNRFPLLFFCMCMFYQFLCVPHSCSSTQSWGIVLPFIVETRGQNSRGCPLLFLFRIFVVHKGQKSYTPTAFEKFWTTPGVRCIIHVSLEIGLCGFTKLKISLL